MCLLVERHAYAERKVFAYLFSESSEEHPRESQAVVDAVAVLVAAVVDIGRPEGVDQVSVCDQLDSVESRGDNALGSRAVVAYDSLAIPFLHSFGGCAVRSLADA